MEYAMINDSEQRRLRAERLLSLEADHYRHGLVLEDAGSPEEANAARRSQDDIERRMRGHRIALGIDPVPAIEEPDGSHVDVSDSVPAPIAEADTMVRVA